MSNLPGRASLTLRKLTHCHKQRDQIVFRISSYSTSAVLCHNPQLTWLNIHILWCLKSPSSRPPSILLCTTIKLLHLSSISPLCRVNLASSSIPPSDAIQVSLHHARYSSAAEQSRYMCSTSSFPMSSCYPSSSSTRAPVYQPKECA